MDFNVTIGGALLAGLFSFVSPCILPLVPPYLCFLAGVTIDEHARKDGNAQLGVVCTALAFVLGFTTAFVLLGATASVIGQALTKHLDAMVIVAGALVLLMGLNFLGILRVPLRITTEQVGGRTAPPGFVGGYVIGFAFAFGWTPCVGPVLAIILFLAASKDTVAQGASLLFVYGLGMGLPFLAAALFASAIVPRVSGDSRRFAHWRRVIGGLLVVTGVVFMTGQMSTFAYWLLETFPFLGEIG
ncbi:MAG: cytochrome c biogenesis CcdA family protein [Hyphomicrobiaceae bacterium]